MTNAATGRPVYGDRFHTGNIEGELLERGFQYASQPGALLVGGNGGHAAVTLPDGTPVSSGEGGVQIGGGGAYQDQFANHMFLPVPPEQPLNPAAPLPPAPVVMMGRPCASAGPADGTTAAARARRSAGSAAARLRRSGVRIAGRIAFAA